MQGDGDSDQARNPGTAPSSHARALLAKRRELAAHQRAIKRHEEAAALQERFGHPDRAASSRRHAQHARELQERALQELHHGRSKAAPGTEPRDPATTTGAGPVSDGHGQVERLLRQLDAAWTALGDSYAGLDDDQLVEPGVVEDWSVKDILAHVTTWEEEALQHLPLIIAGGTPPRYAAQGGLDAFNARATEAGRGRSL
ncbi:MAG TPA: maleylpyruvate isomerase N-terminal domain-containing protein, partial [Actinomycetes bacterium]